MYDDMKAFRDDDSGSSEDNRPAQGGSN